MKKTKTERNERTGKHVSMIAGRILNNLTGVKSGDRIYVQQVDRPYLFQPIGRVSDIKKLAASALTQTPDHIGRRALKK
jgi:hypothetical protein